MPKLSDRDKLAELFERQKRTDAEITATRQRLRERYARIVLEVAIEGLSEREFRDVLGQVARVGGSAAIAVLKPLPDAG